MNYTLYGKPLNEITGSDQLARHLNTEGVTLDNIKAALSLNNTPPGIELRIDDDGDYRLGVWSSYNEEWINVYLEGDRWNDLDLVNDRYWQGLEKVAPLLSQDTSSVATFSGGGVRSSDEDKPHFEQLQVSDLSYEDQPLTRAAQRMAEGAKTYGARNHEKMNDREALERCYGSSLRHLQQLGEEVFHGTRVDNEDHLAAVICNMVMLAGIMGRLEK